MRLRSFLDVHRQTPWKAGSAGNVSVPVLSYNKWEGKETPHWCVRGCSAWAVSLLGDIRS